LECHKETEQVRWAKGREQAEVKARAAARNDRVAAVERDWDGAKALAEVWAGVKVRAAAQAEAAVPAAAETIETTDEVLEKGAIECQEEMEQAQSEWAR